MALYVFGLDGAPMICETPEGRVFTLWQQDDVERAAWRLAHDCVRTVCRPDAPVQSIIEAFEMGYVLMAIIGPAAIDAELNKGGK